MTSGIVPPPYGPPCCFEHLLCPSFRSPIVASMRSIYGSNIGWHGRAVKVIGVTLRLGECDI